MNDEELKSLDWMTTRERNRVLKRRAAIEARLQQEEFNRCTEALKIALIFAAGYWLGQIHEGVGKASAQDYAAKMLAGSVWR